MEMLRVNTISTAAALNAMAMGIILKATATMAQARISTGSRVGRRAPSRTVRSARGRAPIPVRARGRSDSGPRSMRMSPARMVAARSLWVTRRPDRARARSLTLYWLCRSAPRAERPISGESAPTTASIERTSSLASRLSSGFRARCGSIFQSAMALCRISASPSSISTSPGRTRVLGWGFTRRSPPRRTRQVISVSPPAWAFSTAIRLGP